MSVDFREKGSLSGRILDPDGKPASGARVWIDTWESKLLAEAQSDTDGHFHLSNLEPVYRHRFPVLIEAGGFARQYVSESFYSIFPGVDNNLGDIQVYRGRVYIGQVLDVDGKPPSDAEITGRVYVYYLGNSVTSIGPDYHLTLDCEGRFRTPPMPVGVFCITVLAAERILASQIRQVQLGGEEPLDPIRLEPDVPIQGTVKDEEGRPIAGADINANAEFKTTSDSEGRFTIHGFGPNPRFQFQLRKEGYVFINRGMKGRDDGIYWHDVGEDNAPEHGPIKELDIVLKSVAWFEGKALDAETGESVKLDRVVLCFFERNANGEVVLSGCRSPRFEQPEIGRFRITYSYPDEYHLTFSAAGYHDAEAFTPKVTELKTIQGIVVKLKKKTEGADPVMAKQTISGAVTRHGKPVMTGWIGLWRIQGKIDVCNAYILRGRTVTGDPIIYASTLIRDGKYSLDVPYQHEAWFVTVEEPSQAITQIGPINIDINQKKQLDIECTTGGSISGRVKNVPPGWAGHLWVVAFTKTAIQKEVRVGTDDEFCIGQLPPGEYGLKVGHNAYMDSEVPRIRDHKDIPKEVWNAKSDPWKRAKIVTVKADHESSGVELELPPE